MVEINEESNLSRSTTEKLIFELATVASTLLRYIFTQIFPITYCLNRSKFEIVIFNIHALSSKYDKLFFGGLPEIK